MKRSPLFGAVALFAIWAGSAHNALGQPPDATATTTVTNATGTIAQLNYLNPAHSGISRDLQTPC